MTVTRNCCHLSRATHRYEDAFEHLKGTEVKSTGSRTPRGAPEVDADEEQGGDAGEGEGEGEGEGGGEGGGEEEAPEKPKRPMSASSSRIKKPDLPEVAPSGDLPPLDPAIVG
eukprot:COSAG05_NODE_3698_length_1898_cov_1.566426_2_plen_113_part_00